MAERSQPTAVEVAETRDGVTADTSHLRANGTRITICGLPTPSETWYPVTNQEADQFGSCDDCSKFASRYRVASRPIVNARPLSEIKATIDLLQSGIGFAPSGYIDIASALAQTLFERLDGKAVVPQSVLWEVVELVRQIVEIRRPGHDLNSNEATNIYAWGLSIRNKLQPFLGAEPDRMTQNTR